MNRNWNLITTLICLASTVQLCSAQTSQPEPAINVINGTISAFGYTLGTGTTKVIMGGTAHASQANGEAFIDAKGKGTRLDVNVKNLPQATTLGPEFLTYVLWTVTPDGTTTNLGEILVDDHGSGRLGVSSQSQTFALIVTAEPYYAVRMPSEVIVLQNKNTTGQIYPDNSYKLMKRGEYAQTGNPLALTLDLKKTPLDMYEARNAVQIAKARGAEKYAARILQEAEASLLLAENALSQRARKDQILTAARQSVQFAEDARAVTAQQQLAERIEKEKEAAAAKAKAEAEARAAEDARRQEELTEAKEAQMRAEAAAKAAEQKAESDAAAAKAAQEAAEQQAAAAAEQAILKAKADAAAEAAAQAQAATVALRALLLKQLNEVLHTTDTPRGLVVKMADVLFETGKYALSKDAQLKLAKLSGIIGAHPGLILAIEGYTDTTGTAARNMTLSQQRADSVRSFLITEGLSPSIISAKGLGQANPIADNGTAAGRQANRRVEIILSGQIIGVKVGQ
ncbi:MAG: OmpA family protein [Candidatus Melainabacteria bacterium]|nr:OmpA family protein [Candidatus Melainabacteria bacterium]